jgi:hypothetical protein
VDLDRPEGLGVWRDRLTDLVEDYIARFREQCPHLALVIDPATRPTQGMRQPAPAASTGAGA